MHANERKQPRRTDRVYSERLEVNVACCGSSQSKRLINRKKEALRLIK